MRPLVSILMWCYFSLHGLSLLAQTSSEELKGGIDFLANAHYGYVVPEYSSFTLLTNEAVNSLEFSVEKRLGDRNPWNSVFKYPTVGMTFFYTTLGNDEIHGKEYSLYPYVVLPIFERNKCRAGISLGLGLGYVTKKYDPESNPFNVVVGSHLNVHFQTKVDLKYQFNSKFGVQAGLAFGHLSNANTAEPNIGINNGTLYLGAFYRLKETSVPISKDTFQPSKDLFYEVAVAPGYKSTRALRDSRHLTISLTGDLWKPVSRMIAVGIGSDLFFDSSAETELLSDETTEYKDIMQWSTGIHASFSLRYDRLRLILQAGLYVGLPNQVENDAMYNRAMVRYAISEKLITYFAMKSHLHILDHPELGIGYRWNK